MNRLTLTLAAVLVVGGIASASGWAGYQKGYSASQSDNAAALVEVERANRQIGKEYIRDVDRIAEDAEKERRHLEERLVGANDAVDSLRAAVRRSNARSDPVATGQSDAATARTLLAECAARYRDVAEEADQLRARVLGLQEYGRTVSEPID